MVAHATTTLLPTLTPADKTRLRLYFVLQQSVEALANELLQIHHAHKSHQTSPTNSKPPPFLEALEPLSPIQDSEPTTQDFQSEPSGASRRSSSPLHRPPPTADSPPPDEFDLAAWTLSDSIAPHIAYRRAEIHHRRKERALQELETVINTTSNTSIEKRRAATTILRILTTQLSRAARNSDSPHPPFPRPRTSECSPHLPIPQSPNPSTPSTPDIPATSETPEEIVTLTLFAIQHPDTPAPDTGPTLLYNLTGHIADDSPASLSEFKASDLKPLQQAWRFKSAAPAPISISGDHALTTVPLTLHDEATLELTIELIRSTSGDLAGCWLLTHLACESRRGTNTS